MALRNIPLLNDTPENVLAWRRSVQDTVRFVPLFGRGAPSIDAPIGSLYVNLDGGAGTTLYVKEAVGATGWVAK